MRIKSFNGKMKEIECKDTFADMFSIFMNMRYEEYKGDGEENLSVKQIIYGVKKYVNAQQDYFRGFELLFDVNDISDLLDNALTAIITSQEC